MSNKRSMFWQLFFRLFWGSLLSFAVVFLIMSYKTKELVYDHSQSKLKIQSQLLQEKVKNLFNDIQANQNVNLLDEKARQSLRSLSLQEKVRISLINDKGDLLFDSHLKEKEYESQISSPEVVQAMEGSPQVNETRSEDTHETYLFYSEKVLFNNSRDFYILRLGILKKDLSREIYSVLNAFVYGGFLYLLFILLFSALFSLKFTRPLEQMQSVAAKISQGDFSERINLKETVNKESQQLGQAINEISIQLKKRLRTEIEQKNEINAILSSMDEGVIALDGNEKVMYINEPCIQMLNINSSDIIGKYVHEVVRQKEIQDFIAKAFLEKMRLKQEKLVEWKGEDFWYCLESCILKSAKNKERGILIIIDDITHLKTLENHRKDFVANVSHELRTPLTSIRGFVETLMDSKNLSDEEQQHFLGIVFRQSQRLNEIIDDLLALSKIERDNKNHEILLEEGDLVEICDKALESYYLRAKERIISLDKVYETSPKIVLMSASLLEQAVSNLIDNAFKYSHDHSKIEIDIKEKEAEYWISIKDEGEGISPEHHPRLFERFYRVEKDRNRDHKGGTGLGLSIVKNVALVHGGRVHVESRPGRGASFFIIIPKLPLHTST